MRIELGIRHRPDVRLLVVLAAASVALLAQVSAWQALVFRSGTQLTVVGFHVTSNKSYVAGLRASDFELLEDGKPRPITMFEDGADRHVPVEIALLFDYSGSVTDLGLLDEKLFRDNLLAGLPQVTLSVYGFRGWLARFTGPTDDADTLRRAFQGVVKRTRGEATFDLGKPGMDSLIYESVSAAVKEISRSPQVATRLLVVVSDGIPGSDADPAEAAASAREAGIAVYPLVVGHKARVRELEARIQEPPPLGSPPDTVTSVKNYRTARLEEFENQVAAFAQLGESTGGCSFDPLDLNAKAARDIIQFLAGQVRFEYVAGFTPDPNSPPRPHKITVRLVGHKEATLVGGMRVAVY